MAALSELAGRAYDRFEASDYDGCLESLRSITAKRPKDIKVALNSAVARHYKAGQTDPMNLYRELEQVNALVEKARESAGDDFEDEADGAGVTYNMAVVKFHMRKYREALQLLEETFKFIEAVEESVAHRISFLMLDLYLILHLPEKAAIVLSFLEKSCRQNQQAGPDGSAGDAEGDGAHAMAAADTGSTSVGDSTLEFHVHEYKARVHIVSRAMKACKREVKSALNLKHQDVPTLYLKASYEYLRRNYRKSIKLLNSCPKSSDSELDKCLRVLYFNNLGCIHLQMKKYSSACLYFSKALEANAVVCEPPPRKAKAPMSQFLLDRKFEILYNLGLVLLQTDKPQRAFDCFWHALEFFYRSPRLWYRLAECCVRYSLPDAQSSANCVYRTIGRGQFAGLLVGAAPQARKRSQDSDDSRLSLQSAKTYLRNAQYLLPPTHQAGDGPQPTPAPSAAGGPAEANPAPPFASVVNSAPISPGTLGSLLREPEIEALRCHIQVLTAYIALNQGDPYQALRFANLVLKNPNCIGALRFHAQLYAAEALIRVNRADIAISQLSPENVARFMDAPDSGSDVGPDAEQPPSSMQNAESDSGVCRAQAASRALTTEYAKVSMLLTLAGAYGSNDDLDKAQACLSEASAVLTDPGHLRQCVLLGIYVQLRRGDTSRALAIAKQHRLVPFVE